MIALDLGGIFGKIESNADKLGSILGFLGGASNHADAWWGAKGHTFDMLIVHINDLLKQPHIPNPGHILSSLTQGYQRQTFYPAIMAWIGGYILKEIDLDPRIEQLGRALEKAGFGAVLGVAAYATLLQASSSYSDGADHGLGGGSHFLFEKGSKHPYGGNPHGAYTEPTFAPVGTRITAAQPSSPHPYT